MVIHAEPVNRLYVETGAGASAVLVQSPAALTAETRGQDWREVPEGAMLTHEQALARFRTWKFDQQLRYLSGVRDLAEEAARCHMMDHDGAVQDARRLAVHNAELRDRLDKLLRGERVTLSTAGDSVGDIAGVYLTSEQITTLRAEAAAEGRAEGIREGRQQVADEMDALVRFNG